MDLPSKKFRGRFRRTCQTWRARVGCAVGLMALFSVPVAGDEPPVGPLPPTPREMVPINPNPAGDADPQPLPPIEAPGDPAPAGPIPQDLEESDPLAEPTRLGMTHGFITDRTASRRIELAREKLADEEYNDAIWLLQSVIDRKHDGVTASKADPGRIESLKGLADQILAELPPEARQIYEIQFGIGAREKLDAAWKAGDWKTIEDISRRFFRTTAGQEATYRLAMRAIDQSAPLRGALLLDRLREAGSQQFEPQLSMRLLLAAERANLPELAEASRTRLDVMLNEGANLQAAPDGRGRFARWLEMRGLGRPDQRPVWPTLTGDLDGVAAPERVTVAGGVAWSYAFAGSDADHESGDSLSKTLRRGIEQATRNARAMGEIQLPAFSPVIVGETVIFRTLRDIRAVDTTNGRLLWRTARPRSPLFDHIVANMKILFDEEFQNGQSSHLDAQNYLSQYLWRNVTSGAISTDGRYVYAVENTGIAGQSIAGMIRNGAPTALGQKPYNTLVAYDIQAEGRIAWMIGGAESRPNPLTTVGTYFLGAPLPIGGMLFALAERGGEIQLVAIDPAAPDGARIAWRQPLVTVDRTIDIDPVRRLSGLSPSFSHGLLICPTGTGAIVAVDLRDRTLKWGYRYFVNSLAPGVHQFRGGRIIMGGMRYDALDRRERWVDSIPRIHDSFVLVTPRDSNKLHCLDRETGELLWEQDRDDSLYIGAIVDDLVIVVGVQKIEAIDLSTGESRWRTPLGIETRPTGRGLLAGEVYYLPTTSGRICSIDLESGKILSPSDLGEEVEAGNLAAVNGRLISVSTQSIVGFRSVSELDGVEKGSSDEQAIALRGEDRIMRGELAAGIADLRAAGVRGDNKRARDLLIETLLASMRHDFARYRQHASDVRELIKTPRERIEYSRVYASGLAEVGDAVEAARVLLQVCRESEELGEFEQISEGRRARLDRIVRAELGEIYASASNRDRQEIDVLVRDWLATILAGDEKSQLATLARIAYETAASDDVLTALLSQNRADGELLRAQLLNMEMQARAGQRKTEESIPLVDAGVAGADDFAAKLQGRYQPDEIGSRGAQETVATMLPIRLVGSVPEHFSGWRLHIDAQRRNLIARDAFGREQWRIKIGEDAPARGLPAHADRFAARFQGPLLAVCIDTRLIVLDTSTRSESPQVIWSKTITVSGETNFRRLEPIPARERGIVAPRFAFAGPRVILYAGDQMIRAVEALTGDELWTIATSNERLDLLGDREYVALAESASRAIIRRTSDGALVEPRAEEVVAARVATQGTKIIRWETDESGRALACYDMARGEEVWRFDFAPTALRVRLGSDRVVVLDPDSGRLQVIRWTDGTVVLSTKIKANSSVTAFALLEAGARMILLTETGRHRRLGGTASLGYPWEPFQGLARGLDASGRVIWSKPLEYCSIHCGAPGALPLFATMREQRDFSTGQTHWTLTLIDARSGKTLVEKARENIFVPMAIEGDPGRGVIEVGVPEARFVVEPALDAVKPSDPAS